MGFLSLLDNNSHLLNEDIPLIINNSSPYNIDFQSENREDPDTWNNNKNNPYKISWNDGDTTWIRENQFKSHSSFDVSDSAGCKRSFEYYFDRTIGVKEVTEKIEFTLYPNPTHGILNFSTSTIQKVNSLQIFDLFGRMVYELKNVELFEGYSIDLSHLQNGVYFVVSQTENNQFTNRIIISK